MENTSLTHFDVYPSYHLKMNYLELKNTRKLIGGGGWGGWKRCLIHRI